MNIFVYGDESGVFDKRHNDVFVFGVLVFLDKEEKDKQCRKFLHAERCIRPYYGNGDRDGELKACRISNKHKSNLFRSTNGCIRYAFVISQQSVADEAFNNKKRKQRYLDYVYKVGLKRVFSRLIRAGKIDPRDIDNIYVRFDEHTRGERIVLPFETDGGTQQIQFITEGDVLRLIVSSKLPKAQEYERWVFDEVLPAIHRDGVNRDEKKTSS